MKQTLLLLSVLCLFGCSRFVNLSGRMQDARYMSVDMTGDQKKREYWGMIISERPDFPKEKRFLLATEGAVSLHPQDCCGCKSDVPDYFGKLYLPAKIGETYLRNARDAEKFAISFTRKQIEKVALEMGGDHFELIRIKPDTDLYRFEIDGKMASVFFVPGPVNAAPKDPVRDAILGFDVTWQSDCWIVLPGDRKMKKRVILPKTKRKDRHFRKTFMARMSESYITCGFNKEGFIALKGQVHHVD